jgi:hypothetical protein
LESLKNNVEEGAKVVIADVLETEGSNAAKKLGTAAGFYQIDLRSRSSIFRWQTEFTKNMVILMCL